MLPGQLANLEIDLHGDYVELRVIAEIVNYLYHNMQRNEDAHLLIRQKFESILLEANKEATIEVNRLRKSLSLDSLSLEGKILRVCAVLEQSELLYRNFIRPEYVENWNSEEWLFNFFYNKLLILDRDDSDVLKEAIILGAKYHFILDLYWELAEQTDPYSFSDFLANKPNIFLTSLNKRPFHIADEDFYNIVNWQSHNLIKVIELEYSVMQNLFRLAYSESTQPNNIFISEREKFNKLYENADAISGSEVKRRLKLFIPLRDYDFSLVNEEELRLEFMHFAKEAHMNAVVQPANVYPIIEAYENQSQSKPISGLPFILYALNRYDIWLEEVEKGNVSIHETLLGNFTHIFELTRNEAKQKVEEDLSIFFESNNTQILSKDKYTKALFSELEALRLKLNGLPHLHYFNFCFVEDEGNLKEMFCSNCYFGTDVDRQKILLFDSIVINEKISEISGELFEIFGNLTFKSKNDKEHDSVWEVFSILNKVLLDSTLYRKFTDCLNMTTRSHQNTSKPFYFIMQEFNETLIAIFYEAMEQLKDILAKQHQTNKILFLQDKLKDLRHKESSAKFHGWKQGKFIKYFREFLEIEMAYIKETRGINYSSLSLPLSLKTLSVSSSNNSFGYKNKDVKILHKIYRVLTDKVDLINEQKTSLQTFVDIFTSKNLSDVTGEIHLGCQTVVFANILAHLQQFFHSKLPITISKSALFYSKQGNLLTATNLYKSKNNKSPTSEEIEKFFKTLQ